MAIVNGIATVIMAIVNGVAAFFTALINCLTYLSRSSFLDCSTNGSCGYCGGGTRARGSRVGAAY